MARRATDLETLYADISPRSSMEALMAQAEDTRSRLMGSTRPDLAGTPINTTLVPQTYQQRVMRMWDAYGGDPLFKRLVDRAVEFGANGSQWEVPDNRTDEKWMKRTRGRDTSRGQKLEKEEEFWNTWSSMVNDGVPNCLPGTDQVTAWAIRHMLIGGLFVPHWQLGTIRVGKATYLVPQKITCYPASSITLRRQNALFLQEDILYFKPVNYATTMVEGQFIEAPSFMPKTGIPVNMQQLANLGAASRAGETEAFALKFNWSPGDVVAIRRGQIQTTGQSIYPQPPFYSLLPQLAIRQKMFHADLAILDGIINYIMLYQIGDKDHPPKAPIYKPDGTLVSDGTIAQMRKLIQEGRIGPAMELFVPYYVNLTVKQPDANVLLSDVKYGASATEILQAFGILYPRTAAGARERFDKINISGFEEFLANVRYQVRAFWHLMARHIMTLNPTLTEMPTWSPNPLNTKSDAFMQELVKLKQIGSVSLRTLLRYHGLDDGVELRRIAQEIATEAIEMMNENVPLQFVQQTVEPVPGPGEDEPPARDPAKPAPGAPTGPTTPTGAPAAPGGRQMPKGNPKGQQRKQNAIPPTMQRGRPPGQNPPKEPAS